MSHGPEPMGTTKGLSPATKRIGILAGVAGILGMYLVSPYPPKSTTGNPVETNASQNVANRFSAGGAKTEYTPGVATPTNSAENVSSPQEGEAKEDIAAERHLKAKNLEH
ncbi:Hypothetical predicted protein [Lecanosticta acicola]|uniref:Uncharacterized protein n=1 Tax=Lecanosticta acicola TaxID=111012 RepID=A0AAI9EA76_9PEZI|nr:Hypothetical predicted protein [Lecanosticta acicola]